MVIILKRKELKHYIYNYFLVKAIINLLICVIGIGYRSAYGITFPASTIGTYANIFLEKYVVRNSLKMLFGCSTFNEIYMITERYFTIKDKKKWFLRVKLKFYVPFVFLFPIFMSIIFFFSTEIKKVENKNLYTLEITELGMSIPFKLYSISVVVLINLIMLFALTIMNILTARAYMKYTNAKRNLGNRRSNSKKEKRFSRSIIILTIIHVTTEISEVSLFFFKRTINFLNLKIDLEITEILICARQIVMLLTFAAHAFDAFIYVSIDQNLKRLIKNIFRRNAS